MNSSYGRLNAAWLGTPSVLLGERDGSANTAPCIDESGDACGAPAGQAHAPRVLVTRHLVRPPESLQCGLVVSRLHADRVYRLDPVRTTSVADVLQWCRVEAPRILLIDLELLRSAHPREVCHLRKHLPATDWLIASDHALSAADIAPYGWARGCISWATDAATLAKALDAVTAGHLWFPRGLVESLYLALLSGREYLEAVSTHPDPTAPLDEPLTVREAEVLALMRQGMSNKQIADRLEISINTVKKHLIHAFEKRGINRRRQEL
jgi:DNA-binding NarL/FixJ family response regulator